MHVISVAAQTDKHRRRKAMPFWHSTCAWPVNSLGQTWNFLKCVLKESCGALNMKLPATFLQDIHVRISGNLGQQGLTHSSTDTVTPSTAH